MRQAFSILLLATILVGCSANDLPEKNKANKESEFQIENKDEAKQQKKANEITEYQPNPQVTDDRSLLKVGQSYQDGKGEATLKAIKNINKTVQIGPIEMTIKEMKQVHLRPDYSMIDYFHVLTHDEEFDFVKVFVEIKNTSSEKVNFAPIALLKTNAGETFDWEKDIYLEELNGEIEGNAVKRGNIGFIVNATDAHAHEEDDNEASDGDSHQEEQHDETKNLEWIEIITSDVFNQNEKKISDSQKMKIEF